MDDSERSITEVPLIAEVKSTNSGFSLVVRGENVEIARYRRNGEVNNNVDLFAFCLKSDDKNKLQEIAMKLGLDPKKHILNDGTVLLTVVKAGMEGGDKIMTDVIQELKALEINFNDDEVLVRVVREHTQKGPDFPKTVQGAEEPASYTIPSSVTERKAPLVQTVPTHLL